MLPNFIDKSLLPHKPGIYIYKDESGQVLYVGKAIDLYSRVSSYFNNKDQSVKTIRLVENIVALETTIVESELEALILEANLIKKYLPPYNVRLTDDKDYLYIAITKEDFPKVITARKKDLKPIKAWFGPFPSASTVKTTLKQLRKVFPWCSRMGKVGRVGFLDSYTRSGTIAKTGRACFYYHLNLCPGACVGKISKEDYDKIIRRFSKFLSGQKQELVDELEAEMQELSKVKQFEEAAKVKRILVGIYYLTQTNRVSKYLENKNFLEDENNLALAQLQKVLNLPEFPERIEAYDISNFQGQEATGSMVVLTHGEIDKSQYRRFKIKISGKPNDYAMHAEMMQRRLNHPEWGIPQLILIDGGRGQVRAVKDEIATSVVILANEMSPESAESPDSGRARMTNTSITPLFGLAKRMEWLYPPEGEVIKLPKRSLALRLLQKIRDESHRFAINYHRKLRAKSFGLKT